MSNPKLINKKPINNQLWYNGTEVFALFVSLFVCLFACLFVCLFFIFIFVFLTKAIKVYLHRIQILYLWIHQFKLVQHVLQGSISVFHNYNMWVEIVVDLYLIQCNNLSSSSCLHLFIGWSCTKCSAWIKRRLGQGVFFIWWRDWCLGYQADGKHGNSRSHDRSGISQTVLGKLELAKYNKFWRN